MSELRVEPHPRGIVVVVRAVPGASRDRVVGLLGDAIKVAVTAPPEKGKANERIAEVLAKELGLRARGIYLLSGATSRDKRFVLTEITEDELRARLSP